MADQRQHTDAMRCPACRAGAVLDDDICTCLNCGHLWGVYETEAGIKLFFQRLYEGWHVDSEGRLVRNDRG